MTETKRTPIVSDAVLVNAQIGIVKYVGPLQQEKGTFFGVEMSTKPSQGHNGKLNNTTYFTAKEGHGIFTKTFDRIVPPEELLNKITSLYEVIKQYKNKYDEVLRQQESLRAAHNSVEAKCQRLEEENKLLREEAVKKTAENSSQLNDKMNVWASQFGMRDGVLSSLDESTINEINLLIQNKEQEKRSRRSSRSYVPVTATTKSENDKHSGYDNTLLPQDRKNDDLNSRNSHSKNTGDNRKNETNSDEDGKLGQRMLRGSRGSVVMSTSTVTSQILENTVDTSSATKTSMHRSTPSDIDIAAMDADWQKKINSGRRCYQHNS